MVLVLRESDIAHLIDMRTTVSCIEDAFREQSNHKVLQPPRQILKHEDGSPSAIVRVMSASVPGLKALGLKALLGVPAKRKQHSTYFVTLLFDTTDASLLAIMASNRLTQLRTGGASGVATKYLSRRASKSVGILGAGVQGYGQLEGVSAVLQVHSVMVYDLDKAREDSFKEKVARELGLDVSVARDVDELCRNEIICTATPATEPTIFADRLMPGTHINAIGSNAPNRQEIHEGVLLASRVFVDMLEQVLEEAGDLVIPIMAGKYDKNKIIGEICDLVTGKIKGRLSDGDITLFKSVGIALEDIAVARAAYDIAMRKGAGLDIKL